MIDDDELTRRADIVVGMGGVVPYAKVFYQLSIKYCVSRAYEYFERYEAARVNEDSDEIQVGFVHEALGHAAALSRFFWPSGLGNKSLSKLRKARAKTLKDLYGIDNHSALKNRSLRDSLEHYDERLDRYLLENEAGTFFPTAIIGNADLADDSVGNIFRLVDPVKKVFVVMGAKHEFGAIQQEVERLHHRSQAS